MERKEFNRSVSAMDEFSIYATTEDLESVIRTAFKKTGLQTEFDSSAYLLEQDSSLSLPKFLEMKDKDIEKLIESITNRVLDITSRKPYLKAMRKRNQLFMQQKLWKLTLKRQ